MLRTITELVPFGDDASAKRICGYYLANVTNFKTNDTGLYEYIIGFFEVKSAYARDGVVKFKHLTGWDRMKSNFELQQEIFKEGGWVDSLETTNEYLKRVVEIMFSRAITDGVYTS